jgi:tetratricopeptide (TPR) repeat protein
MRYAQIILIVSAVLGSTAGADLGRGRELYSQGKYDEAISELRQVVNEQGDNADANRLLGLALIEDGKASEAEKYVNTANELGASGETKLAMARLAVAQKNVDRAEQLLGDASGDDLDYVRGLVALHRDRHQEAADAFEAYLKDHPNHAYAHYYAGMAYNGLRRPDRMLTHFETFLRLKPDAPEARKVRAVVRTGR